MSGDEDPPADSTGDQPEPAADPVDAFADELGDGAAGSSEADSDDAVDAQAALDDMMDDFGPDEPETGDAGPPADVFGAPGQGDGTDGGPENVDAKANPGAAGERPAVDGDGQDAGAAEDPFGDILDDVAERERTPEDDPFADAFESVELDEVDTDALWSDLETDDFAETVEDPRSAAERDTHVIEKRSYCQRCQYFSDPPDTACTNDGTEILEVVDTQHFRVADCPIVRGEEEFRKKR